MHTRMGQPWICIKHLQHKRYIKTTYKENKTKKNENPIPKTKQSPRQKRQMLVCSMESQIRHINFYYKKTNNLVIVLKYDHAINNLQCNLLIWVFFLNRILHKRVVTISIVTAIVHFIVIGARAAVRNDGAPIQPTWQGPLHHENIENIFSLQIHCKFHSPWTLHPHWLRPS